MAQQARPNVAGHTELLRASPMTCSTVVRTTPLGSFSSRPISVPLQTTATPDIGVRDEDGDDEEHHFDETEHPEVVEGDRQRIEENDLDVENDEKHRRQVVLHREPPAADGLRKQHNAAFVRLEPSAVPAFQTKQ